MNDSQILQVQNINKDALITEIANRVVSEIKGVLHKETPKDKRRKEIEEMKSNYLSRDEACEMLGISNGTLHKLIRNKEIEYVKNGRYTLISIQSIKNYIARNTNSVEG